MWSRVDNSFDSELPWVSHKSYFRIIRQIFFNIYQENDQKVDFQKMICPGRQKGTVVLISDFAPKEILKATFEAYLSSFHAIIMWDVFFHASNAFFHRRTGHTINPNPHLED